MFGYFRVVCVVCENGWLITENTEIQMKSYYVMGSKTVNGSYFCKNWLFWIVCGYYNSSFINYLYFWLKDWWGTVSHLVSFRVLFVSACQRTAEQPQGHLLLGPWWPSWLCVFRECQSDDSLQISYHFLQSAKQNKNKKQLSNIDVFSTHTKLSALSYLTGHE